MASFDFKKLTPHLLIIAIFAIFSFLFNYPALQGKMLNQHDNVSWQAMSKEAKDYYEKTGKNPLWTNSMFGGMPTYTIYVAKSNNVAMSTSEFIQKIIIKPAYFFFLAMLGFYVLMICLRANRWVAAIGAMAYAFAAYNPQIIAAGHETKMLAMGYMPGVLGGFILLFRGKYAIGAAVLALFLALLFSTNHFQVAYYMFMILGGAWIGYFIQHQKKGTLKTFAVATGIAVLAAVIGLAPNAAAILSTKDYDQYSMRSGKSELTNNQKSNKGTGGLDKDYAFQWSNGVGEVLTILVPNLYGGGSQENLGTGSNFYEKLTSVGVPEQNAEQYAAHAPTYWGPQPFLSGPAYLGAIICFLFVFAMFTLRSPHKWWVLALSVLALLMSMGKNFAGLNYLLFDTLPLFNKFRTPSMIVVIPQLLFCFSAMWVLNEVIKGSYDKTALMKNIKWSVGITAGLSVLLALGGSLFFDFKAAADAQIIQQFSQGGGNAQLGNEVVDALRDDRQSMAMKSGFRSAFFILMAAAALWYFVQSKINSKQLLIALGLFLAIDMLPIAHKYLNDEHYLDKDTYENAFALSPTDQQILQDKDPFYRVLDVSTNTYNDAMPAYHHHLIGGYNPAKMEIYQDLINNHLSDGGFNSAVLNMLNTKYIVFPGGNGQNMVQGNAQALGNAWFVNNIKWVATADEEMASLQAAKIGDTTVMANAFDPAATAVVRQTFQKDLGAFQPYKDSASNIKLTQYDLMEMKYQTQNAQEGLAVFSDIWYPGGWKAYIDGKPAEIVRANYVLRALKVPAGNHEVVFKFEPKSFATGMNIALAGSVLLLLLCGFALFKSAKAKGDEEDAAIVTATQKATPANTETVIKQTNIPASAPKKKKGK